MRGLAALLLLAGCSGPGGDAPAAAGWPEQGGARFAAFAAACGHCHAPPQPGLHTKREWAQVVARMQRHRAERGVRLLSEAEQAEVLGYLEDYARDGRLR